MFQWLKQSLTRENDHESVYSTVISNIQKSLGKGLVWNFIDILKCKLWSGSSFKKLPKKLNHPKKGLINIQNIDDNKSFKGCLVSYVHPADLNLVGILEADKSFVRELDFKDIKVPLKIRDIHKIEEKRIALTFLILVMKKKRKIPNLCLKKYF